MSVSSPSPAAALARTLDLTTSTGRAFRLQIEATRDGLGRRRYRYLFPDCLARVSLSEESGRTPYLKVEPPLAALGQPLDWRLEERILPLTADTLGIIRVVRAAIDPPFQAGWLGRLLAILHRFL